MRALSQIFESISSEKRALLTDAFLNTFKEELDRIFEIEKKEKHPTYSNVYGHLLGTIGFDQALQIASEKYQLVDEIYNYVKTLPWDQKDSFDVDLAELMVRRNIIEEG
ncbi:hypothetical protein [Paenibacillus marinisediminis]